MEGLDKRVNLQALRPPMGPRQVDMVQVIELFDQCMLAITRLETCIKSVSRVAPSEHFWEVGEAVARDAKRELNAIWQKISEE